MGTGLRHLQQRLWCQGQRRDRNVNERRVESNTGPETNSAGKNNVGNCGLTWRPRCVCCHSNPSGSDRDRLWLYGGLTEPFSNPLDDMWSSEDRKTLVNTRRPEENNNPAGKPIAAALMVIKEKLTLFGSFAAAMTVK